ncbi:serine/threonine-protein kinase [Plantactinospora sp. B6F1]|uniref:serine/threonine-protein kinase n=1 Tax=Plantactinospora sp. B6F1 TaxID=3158971 RepID=UPI0032D93122
MSERTLINERYELDQFPIGKGGMGEVWGGRDIRLGREVAVKFIRYRSEEQSADLVRRFEREAKITARLEHPGVPAVYDVGVHEGRSYLVMQRIRGITVAELIAEQGTLPIGWVAAIAAQTCAVLTVAHRASLIHRDLKPNNLMLEPTGAVKVLDFGLAVAVEGSDFSRITRTGESLGTLPYMAPEQILLARTDARTDLYAVGCTLHEMLAGEPLVAGPSPYVMMRQQVHTAPPPIRSIRPDVPAELERILNDLLQKRPEDRPASADLVYRRLLPFVTRLGPLPGAVDRSARSSPLRAYAHILSRVLVDGGNGAEPGSAHSNEPAPSPTTNLSSSASEPASAQTESRDLTRAQLDRARSEAKRLVEQSRHRQAADLLIGVAEPASRIFGPLDDDVLSLRMRLAEVLYNGGDYRRAAPAYQQLAADLARRPGLPPEAAFDCRRQAAACNALTGRTSLALRQLGELRDDERREFGDDHERVAELGRQIELLRPSAGHR